jgi:hypothetical protein
MIGIERRKCNRINASYLVVFRPKTPTQKSPIALVGHTRDISAGGLFIYTRSEVEGGGNVALTIYPTGDWREDKVLPKIEVEGRVMRVERAPETYHRGYFNGIAIKFKSEPDVLI